MSIDFTKAAEQSATAALRGKTITFSDGKEWVIPTLRIKERKSRLNELCRSGMEQKKLEEEELIELVELAIKLNYPDVKVEDVNPDLEDMFNVMVQVTGQNLKK